MSCRPPDYVGDLGESQSAMLSLATEKEKGGGDFAAAAAAAAKEADFLSLCA